MKISARSLASGGATLILVCCALAVTVITVRRELRGAEPTAAASKFEPQKDWLDYATDGHRLGPANAKAVLVEFSDFECPACALFSRRVQVALKKYPNDFAVVHRHYPLTKHLHAVPAAVASECAARQGKFESMYFALFANSDSLGKVAWRRFAEQAQVADLPAFDRCMSDPVVAAAVREDRDAGEQLGTRATPTLLMNGVRFTGAMTQPLLDSLIESVIAGNSRRASAP